MRLRKRFIPFIFLSFLSFVALGGLILFVDPSANLQILGFSFAPILPFLAIIFFSFFFIFSFLFLSKRRGFAVGLFVILFLILRFFGFREIFQVVILFLIVVLFDFFFLVKKG